MLNCRRMSKRDWYLRGGFSTPRLFRKMCSGAWTYWEDLS